MPNQRVLIFGAYGNGNLGDTIQPVSLARQIAQIRPDIELFAASHLRAADYPFDAAHKLLPAQILDADVVNTFDLIMIGGGGLLAWPHVPLADAKWVGGLKVPVALWGVGADAANASSCAALVKRADYVSGRCIVSLRALAAFAQSVHFVCDPVMADQAIVPPMPRPADASRRICWVLRGPLSDLHAVIARHVTDDDIVVCFEEAIDWALRAVFPGMLTVRSVAEFASHAVQARSIISMRYHGIILGARLGIPVFALAVDKAARLMQALGLPECASATPEPLVIASKSRDYDTQRTLDLMAWHARSYAVQLRRLLDTFVPV